MSPHGHTTKSNSHTYLGSGWATDRARDPFKIPLDQETLIPVGSPPTTIGEKECAAAAAMWANQPRRSASLSGGGARSHPLSSAVGRRWWNNLAHVQSTHYAANETRVDNPCVSILPLARAITAAVATYSYISFKYFIYFICIAGAGPFGDSVSHHSYTAAVDGWGRRQRLWFGSKVSSWLG